MTGSSGFLGSNIVKKLSSKYVIIKDSVNDKRVNLQNREQVLKFERADILIHLGAKIPYQKSEEPSYYFDNNVVGTLNILEYCVRKKVKKLIYVSTYVYGYPKYCPIDEKHKVTPHTPYTESKYICERLCKSYSDHYDLDLVILRPFNIFGKSRKTGFLIPNLIRALNTRNKVTITNKTSKRDYLYVDDFVNAISTILESEFHYEIFNVGSGVSYSFENVMKMIERITKKKFRANYKQDPKIFIKDIRADISKITNKTGWKPQVTLEEGLKKLLN